MFIRKSNERGHNEISWLNTYHSFSFASYRDPLWQGFHQLLVINEDRIAPATGFGTHPHREMEIITYVISGELRHKDSMGNLGVIKPGEIQVMSAGSGITHSEHNNKDSLETHLLQIWVLPSKLNLTPRYDQQKIFEENEFNFLKCIATPVEFSSSATAVFLNAHAKIWLGRYNKTASLEFKPTLFKHFWIQMIKGELNIADQIIKAGDAMAFEAGESIGLHIVNNGAEFLIIEVA